MAKQTRGKSSSFGCKSGKRSRQADTETHPRVIDINRFSQRKHPSRIPACHNPLIQARNQAQGHYLAAIMTHQLTFELGLAGLNGVYVHEFEAADIVRSGLVRAITARYETG